MDRKKGFTLVEILVVIAIIGLITAIAVPSIMSLSKKMKERGLDSKVNSIEQSAVIFTQENANKLKEKYPTSIGEDGNYHFTLTVKDLVTNGVYKSEKTEDSTCEIVNPYDGTTCLDCLEVKITLDKDYKTSSAIIDREIDKYLTNVPESCTNQFDFRGDDEWSNSVKTFKANIKDVVRQGDETATVVIDEFSYNDVKNTFDYTAKSDYTSLDNGYKINGFSTKELGTKTAVVTKNGRSSTFTYEVRPKEYAYTINHYLMDASGNYPSTPSYIDEGKEELNKTFPDLRKSDLGPEYDLSKTKTTGPTTITNEPDKNVVSYYYERKKYNIIIQSNNTSMGTIASGASGVVYYGGKYSFTISEKTGYYYKDITSVSGVSFSKSGNKITITASDMGSNGTNKIITVNFAPRTYRVDVNTFVNGTRYDSGLKGYEFDVYVNGTKVKTGIDYCEYLNYGSIIEVRPKDVTGYTTKVVDAANQEKTSWTVGTSAFEIKPTWTPRTYTVSFNANGGSIGTTSKSVTYNSQYSTLPTPTRTGYDFNGWYTAPSGGTQVTSSTKVTSIKDHTIYAQWTLNTVTVTYDANGGYFTNNDIATANSSNNDYSHTGNTQIHIPITYGSKYGDKWIPEDIRRDGYKFAGWYDAISGGNKITESSVVNTNSNHTLYARWKKKINVQAKHWLQNETGTGYTYDSTTYPTSSIYEGESWTPSAKTYTGFTFSYKSPASADSSQSIVNFYYTRDSYTITFNANGGIPSTQNKTLRYYQTYGGTSGSLPTVTRSGYTFVGWFNTSSQSGGTEVTASTKVTTSSPRTLYARWKVSALGKLEANGVRLKTGTPDFNNISPPKDGSPDDSGLYAMEDDDGMSYYFRGNIQNNYVKFGKYPDELYSLYSQSGKWNYDNMWATFAECNAYLASKYESNPSVNYDYICGKSPLAGKDIWWRIVRINGDGSVRIMYDGIEAHNNNDKNTRYIINNGFNRSDDNKYAGYMYGGTEGVASTSKAQAQKNETESRAKKELDYWYELVFSKSAHRYYIADEVFCNDRSTPDSSNALGYARNSTYYGARIRNNSTPSPTFKCDMNTTINQKNDRFTVSTNKGNGALKYPIGLITMDELIAGGHKIGMKSGDIMADSGNENNYLNRGSTYVTMTPYRHQSSGLEMIEMSVYPDLYPASFSSGLVPVINLTEDTFVNMNGRGLTSDPYRVSWICDEEFDNC